MSLGDKCVPKEQGCLSTMDSKILLPLPAPSRVYLSIYSLVLGVCCGVEDWRRNGTRRGMRLCLRHLQAVSRLRRQTSKYPNAGIVSVLMNLSSAQLL